ncbi:MAG: hypothetical protein M3239_00375 [Thermoproteota archaeon]|nr:hypothetical protein [Thermoproteota archaeon]
MIRHCVEESNVDGDMSIIDPNKIRHVTVAGGKIVSMSGLIDPVSHLNLDFSDHRVTICIIAEAFEKGANVKMDGDGFVFATVPKSSYRHYGYVDYTQRLVDMIKAVKRNQEYRKSRQTANQTTEA